MALVSFSEKRLQARMRLNGKLPGKLIRGLSKSEFFCRPLDVSRHGLGIVSNQELEVGETFSLETSAYSVTLRVVWEKSDFAKQDLKRYGLEVEDLQIDLIELCRQADCIPR
jgi:hypothetical protein